MRFLALATDYDGTIARDGVVDDPTIEALERLRKSGRKLIMVTGRELDDLIRLCPKIDLFDLVVAENGAVLYDPSDKQESVLSGGPSIDLVNRLRAAGVSNISVGRSIVALWKPNEVESLEAIRDLGLELHIVFNKDAVMILPSAVNKATGLAEALKRLGLEPQNVVGVGDAENDHSFIRSCGYRVAVENAIPSLKDEVDLVTAGARGEGVQQLVSRMIDAEDELRIKPGIPSGS
jgi:hydroxymethylpyrimidine pyrophosphatase-like HAD family hydrolase